MTALATAAVIEARLQALAALIDAGGGGLLMLYAGPRPPLGVPSAGLQCSIRLAYPCGAVADGVLTLATSGVQGLRVDGQQIGWARLTDAAGAPLIDMDVGVSGSGADVELSRLDGQTGAEIELVSAAFGEA